MNPGAILSAFNAKHGHTVVPVYKSPDGDGVIHEGSAVLVKTTGKHWFYTADHVHKRCEGMVLGSNPNIRLKGPIIFNPAPIDLAYAEVLPEEVGPILAAGMAFLPSDYIAATRASLSNECCAFTGFPDKSVDVDGDEKTSAVWPFTFFSTFLDDRRVIAAGCDPEIHFGAPATKIKKMGDFNPEGFSGGAIWRIRPHEEVKLVGIITDYDPSRALLIGTRIGPLIQNAIIRLAATQAAEENGS